MDTGHARTSVADNSSNSGVVCLRSIEVNISIRAISGTCWFSFGNEEAIPSLCCPHLARCEALLRHVGQQAGLHSSYLTSTVRYSLPAEDGQKLAPQSIQGVPMQRKARVQRGTGPKCAFFAAVRGVGLRAVWHLACCLLVRRFRTRVGGPLSWLFRNAVIREGVRGCAAGCTVPLRTRHCDITKGGGVKLYFMVKVDES